MRQMGSIKKSIGLSVKELNRAVENRTLWTPCIYRLVRSGS